MHRKSPERHISRRFITSILLFTSLLAVPLARQSCLDAFLFAGLQVVGVTLYFLDNVLLLHLPLESAQSIFQRFAFLNANLRQRVTPPNVPLRLPQSYPRSEFGAKQAHISHRFPPIALHLASNPRQARLQTQVPNPFPAPIKEHDTRSSAQGSPQPPSAAVKLVS